MKTFNNRSFGALNNSGNSIAINILLRWSTIKTDFADEF
ncbi:hypothetical protein RC62_4619 [Flavobacterium aquidurense]|uniref:Uncharacterized protein n=1 Tax=Flavobacterium aquidurense TaxID=362413 RepID=A0A0Q0RVR1_9FLAO|nr:hypothetical protein RC62_4619 [Flavobacterium aquidurense]